MKDWRKKEEICVDPTTKAVLSENVSRDLALR